LAESPVKLLCERSIRENDARDCLQKNAICVGHLSEASNEYPTGLIKELPRDGRGLYKRGDVIDE
jgi:hypothetical protein